MPRAESSVGSDNSPLAWPTYTTMASCIATSNQPTFSKMAGIVKIGVFKKVKFAQDLLHENLDRASGSEVETENAVMRLQIESDEAIFLSCSTRFRLWRAKSSISYHNSGRRRRSRAPSR